MPLRGRAMARNFPKFLDGLRSHIGSCSLEGPPWSRDTRPLRADGGGFLRRELGTVLCWPHGLVGFLAAGTALMWLHHTRLAGLPPWRGRVLKAERRVSTPEQPLGTLLPSASTEEYHVCGPRELPGRVRGSTPSPAVPVACGLGA